MKILLTGGGSGGHITPLLSVAHELKLIDSEIELYGVCESNAKFLNLFENEPAINRTYQIKAGKLRRYSGLSKLEKITDIRTVFLNTRDIGRVVRGYGQAIKLLKNLKPDGILIKGGFVGVPVGLAAAKLGIPFITHDSDSTAGLANRIISRWAQKHATGMPIEFYEYPKGSTVYTGIPISPDFKLVDNKIMNSYRQELHLKDCSQVITVIGASQGGTQLNEDIVKLSKKLMQRFNNLGIIHIAGPAHEENVKKQYELQLVDSELYRVVVKGFVKDAYRYLGAADVVISRAGATSIAELAVQAKPTIIVPGQLAGDHQGKNARHLSSMNAVVAVDYGDREGLFEAISDLLTHPDKAKAISRELNTLAKPNAAQDLAKLVYMEFDKKNEII